MASLHESVDYKTGRNHIDKLASYLNGMQGDNDDGSLLMIVVYLCSLEAFDKAFLSNKPLKDAIQIATDIFLALFPPGVIEDAEVFALRESFDTCDSFEAD